MSGMLNQEFNGEVLKNSYENDAGHNLVICLKFMKNGVYILALANP